MAAASPDPKPKSTVGPYEILNKISVGGMAETFVALRKGPAGFEQRVCLKKVLPAFAEDKEFTRLFLDEAKLAANLRHANIVQVYDFGVEDEIYYMALELIEGMDLRALIQAMQILGHSLAPELVVLIATEVASALEYAHHLELSGAHAKIVHRDVSPSNVLLSAAGAVKLADFGIAKAASHAHVTRSGVIKGKVPYMAPEHASGDAIDARSDLFSLGVLLYEACVGTRPFDGPNEMATMHNLLNGVHTPLLEARADVNPHFAEVVEKLIQPKPSDRFDDAGSLLDALAVCAPPSTAKRLLGATVKQTLALVSDYNRTANDGLANVFSQEPVSGMTRTASTPEENSPGKLPTPTPSPSTPEAVTQTHQQHAHASGSTPCPSTPIPFPSSVPQPVLGTPSRSTPDRTPAPIALASKAPTQGNYEATTLPWFKQKKIQLSLAAAVITIGTLIFLVATNSASEPDTTTVALAPNSLKKSTPKTTTKAAAAKPTPVKVAGASPATLADTPKATAAVANTAAEPSQEKSDDDAPSLSEDEAFLHILVIPWGKVWIDGNLAGNSPVSEVLSPGKHTISWGSQSQRKRKRITLEGGQSLKLRLRN